MNYLSLWRGRENINRQELVRRLPRTSDLFVSIWAMANLSSSDSICTSRCSSFQVKNKFRLLRIVSRGVTWRQFILVPRATTADASHVQEVLREIKVKKSPGVDGLHLNYLRSQPRLLLLHPLSYATMLYPSVNIIQNGRRLLWWWYDKNII